MSKHSAACCTIPPVIADNYEPKGKYTTMGGLKTYVTGPDDADTAIFFIYDIFGYFPQTVQGADILAYADKDHSYQVIIPDFFEGNFAEVEWYPPDTAEKGEKLGEWFKIASPPMHLPKIPGIIADAEKHNSNIKTWGAMGYCWGGKMVSLVAGKDTKIKVGVQSSPALIDPADAEKVKIPMAILASKDEDVEEVKAYDANLKVTKHVETFEGMPHGFMSARGDFVDPNAKAAYIRGYEVALKFFHDNL